MLAHPSDNNNNNNNNNNNRTLLGKNEWNREGDAFYTQRYRSEGSKMEQEAREK